ncbi:hypothetical protein [Acinetobacter sp.]|uniref:hypothetical protein n=1 Tax=Acinetobacter sp. TaxID=472 RepID=UPI00388E9641
MKPLSYGMEYPCQLAEGPHPQFEAFKLQLGRGDDGWFPVARYELYGVTVMVYDKVAAGHISNLIASSAPDLEVYLEIILFTALKQNPSYLEYALKDAYNRGVIDGRHKGA